MVDEALFGLGRHDDHGHSRSRAPTIRLRAAGPLLDVQDDVVMHMRGIRQRPAFLASVQARAETHGGEATPIGTSALYWSVPLDEAART